MSLKNSRLFTLSIILISICACASSRQSAPVEERIHANVAPSRSPKIHIVQAGDTLYSIARNYHVDLNRLIKINKLDQSSSLFVGRPLQLEVKPSNEAVASHKASHKVIAPAPVKQPSILPDRSQKKSIMPIKKSAASLVSSSVRWQWPVKGKVLDVFSSAGGLKKGIDIRSELGEPVVAAAEGEVVYSGSGLRGYGKLIIVKHNNEYISAYAHNRVLMVKEKDKVKAGQKIGEVGLAKADMAVLHFQIRRDGVPVDPLKYLP